MNYIWQDFMHHFDFLKKENFVYEDGKLTSDGKWASNLRIDSPLIVAEGLRINIFPKKSPALLSALMTCFVNEKEYDDERVDFKKIGNDLYQVLEVAKKKLYPFMERLKMNGFSTNQIYISPAHTIYSWVKGVSWEELIEISGLAEGDLTRLIMRVSDNLRHLKALKDFFPEISETASIAVDILMREPVISYYEH